MTRDDFPDLAQFLGAYFNQDWPLDDQEPDKVLERFVSKEPEEWVQGAKQDLDRLLSMGFDENEYAKALKEMSCYYDPRLAGQTIEAWLHHVRRSLDHLSTASNPPE